MSIKVLVVDDSLFMRRILADSIKTMKGIELADTAQNGFFALAKLEKLAPDIITLDVEMPVMDGIETVKEIRKISSVPIMMLSANADQETTIHALEIGAQDFIKKPEKINENRKEFSRDLESHIKALVNEPKKRKNQKKSEKNTKNKKKQIKRPKNVDVLMIGASTGGPKVVTEIVKSLPADLSIPVFIVQHMPKGFTASFAKRMNTISKVPVVEAQHRMRYQAGTVYLAPGGQHMVIRNQRIILLDSPKIHSVRPAVDPMFQSVIARFGQNSLAVILTGMGRDGTDGALAVKSVKGYVLAQNEKTCVVYGMPRYAHEAGAVDELLSIKEMIQSINEIVGE